MKKFENAKALNEVEMNAVTGGANGGNILNVFVDLFFTRVFNNDADRPLPFPQDRRAPQAPARPLPFPQDRR